MHWLPNAHTGYDVVPEARHWAERELTGCSERHRERVTLIASELMTNAVMHARGPFRFGIDTTSRCTRVEVWDHSPESAPETLVGPSDRDVGGWGLAIVHRFSDRWGTSRRGRWKCIWSEIATDR